MSIYGRCATKIEPHSFPILPCISIASDLEENKNASKHQKILAMQLYSTLPYYSDWEKSREGIHLVFPT